MAEPQTLDDLFDGILIELEAALDLSIRPDRERRLFELGRRCSALCRLTNAALELSLSERSGTPKNPLD